jgi:hypothetical protein
MISSSENNVEFYFKIYFKCLLPATKADLGVTLLKNKVITCLHWNEVILCCLKFKYQKPNPRGFRIVLHITETSTGAQLVMNYAGFQSQFWSFRWLLGNAANSMKWMLFHNWTTTKFVLYCLLLIIEWEIHGNECHTSKSSLSFSIQMQLFQKRLSKFHMALPGVRKPGLGFWITYFHNSDLNSEFCE